MISCVRGLVLAWIAAGVLLLLYVLQRRQVALVCRGRSTDSISIAFRLHLRRKGLLVGRNFSPSE
jgi:hypothetical protein